jgi:DNA sulfur modification protein DndB
MTASENLLSFAAIRGVQAGREYYVAMCPLKVVPKIFQFDDLELPAEMRAQRTLNRARVPEIATYLSENTRSYILSSITASVDGDVTFRPFKKAGAASNAGSLIVPLSSKFVINDGQHRRAAIEAALKDCPELGEESLSIVFFIDAGLKRSQQMFADLNRHAIRPSKSIGILYDQRDPVSHLAYSLSKKVSVFKNLVEMEKSNIPERTNRLFTLSSIYQATRTLLNKPKKCKIVAKEEELAIDFWEAVGSVIPDWQLAAQKKVNCAELRRDFVHSHGIALQALSLVGAKLLAESPKVWKRKLGGLTELDWSRSNSQLWDGRALVNGRVSKSSASIVLTANLLKSKLGMTLGASESQIESRFARSQQAA